MATVSVPKMCDIVDLEEALSKNGAELFKELYRIYPVADYEDYFKAGQWKNEVMRTDLMLLESHRRECGAPDVPDMEDLKLPFKLPDGVSLPSKPGTAFASTSIGTASANIAGGASSAPVVEIRLIALFVAKWKLDPVSSKTILAKLTPVRRRYVIQNFKTTNTGAEATKELEDFIAQCEKDNAWGDEGKSNGDSGSDGQTESPEAKPAGTVVTPAAALQQKRPTITHPSNPLSWIQNKRPTLGGGVQTAGPGGILRPQVAGVRPAGPVGVRPQGGTGLLGNLLKNF